MVRTKQVQGYTAGSIAPSNPQSGDRWQELSPTGVSLYGWDWIRSADRWVSPEQFWNLSMDWLTEGGNEYLGIDSRNVRLLELRSTLIYSESQTASNFWNIRLFSLRSNNAKTALAEISTADQTASGFNQKVVPLNTLLTFGTGGSENEALMEVSTKPSGSAKHLWGTVRLKYRFER